MVVRNLWQSPWTWILGYHMAQNCAFPNWTKNSYGQFRFRYGVESKTRQPVLVMTRSRHIFQARDKSRYDDVGKNSPDFSHVDICVRTEQDTYDNSVNGIVTLYAELLEKWFHENCEESTRHNVRELRCERRLLLFENMYDTAKILK